MSSAGPPQDDPHLRRPHEQPPTPYPAYGGSPTAYPDSGPWGGPAYPGGTGAAPATGRRPGGVTAAAVITIVMSALTGLFWLFMAIVAFSAGSNLIPQFRDNPQVMRSLQDSGITLAQVRDTLSAVGPAALVLAVLMFLAIVPAVGVLRRSRAARVILVVLSALTVIIGMLFTLVGFFPGLLWAAAGVLVIVLLYTGQAGPWFAQKTGSTW